MIETYHHRPEWRAEVAYERITRMGNDKEAKTRTIAFENAKAQYPHRFTMEHVPAWAGVMADNGLFHAPQFRSDREWYEATRFVGEDEMASFTHCHTAGETWPLGRWLKTRYARGGASRLTQEDKDRRRALAAGALLETLRGIVRSVDSGRGVPEQEMERARRAIAIATDGGAEPGQPDTEVSR